MGACCSSKNKKPFRPTGNKPGDDEGSQVSVIQDEDASVPLIEQLNSSNQKMRSPLHEDEDRHPKTPEKPETPVSSIKSSQNDNEPERSAFYEKKENSEQEFDSNSSIKIQEPSVNKKEERPVFQRPPSINKPSPRRGASHPSQNNMIVIEKKSSYSKRNSRDLSLVVKNANSSNRSKLNNARESLGSDIVPPINPIPVISPKVFPPTKQVSRNPLKPDTPKITQQKTPKSSIRTPEKDIVEMKDLNIEFSCSDSSNMHRNMLVLDRLLENQNKSAYTKPNFSNVILAKERKTEEKKKASSLNNRNRIPSTVLQGDARQDIENQYNNLYMMIKADEYDHAEEHPHFDGQYCSYHAQGFGKRKNSADDEDG